MRTEIDDDADEALFGVFDAAQNLERRVMRIVRRGFFNAQAVMDLETAATGLTKQIADLKALVKA